MHLPSFLLLAKTWLHSDGRRVIPIVFEICLATIGVAFFSALTSVGALFIILKRNSIRKIGEWVMKKIVSFVLALVLFVSLAAPAYAYKPHNDVETIQNTYTVVRNILKWCDERINNDEELIYEYAAYNLLQEIMLDLANCYCYETELSDYGNLDADLAFGDTAAAEKRLGALSGFISNTNVVDKVDNTRSYILVFEHANKLNDSLMLTVSDSMVEKLDSVILKGTEKNAFAGYDRTRVINDILSQLVPIENIIKDYNLVISVGNMAKESYAFQEECHLYYRYLRVYISLLKLYVEETRASCYENTKDDEKLAEQISALEDLNEAFSTIMRDNVEFVEQKRKEGLINEQQELAMLKDASLEIINSSILQSFLMTPLPKENNQ